MKSRLRNGNVYIWPGYEFRDITRPCASGIEGRRRHGMLRERSRISYPEMETRINSAGGTFSTSDENPVTCALETISNTSSNHLDR